MSYNEEFMLKQQNELKEALIHSGAFADGEGFVINDTDVYTKSLIQKKYEEGVIGGEDAEGEVQTLRQLDEIKNYKEQMHHAESSSKLLRGHRINTLREMGNEYGEEVKKNASAEFIREKILAHIELLERNDALPEVDPSPDEKLLDAIEKRMKKYTALTPEDEEYRKDRWAENWELVKAENNFNRRRKYIEENLKPMLNEVSNGTLTSAIVDNLIKSVSTLPAQLKITRLVEERAEKRNKEIKLQQERADVIAQKEKNQNELNRLIAENNNFQRTNYDLKRKKVRLYNEYFEERERLRVMRRQTQNKPNMFVDAISDTCDDLYAEYIKVCDELDKYDIQINKARAIQAELNDRENGIAADIEENRQTDEWRAAYRGQLERYIGELDREKNKQISLRRYYHDIADILQLTPRQDGADTLLDVMNEWLDRSNDRYAHGIHHDMENAPEKIILTHDQGKKLARDLIDDIASGIFVLNRFNVEYSANVLPVSEFLVVGENRLLPRYGMHNIMRYLRFFSDLDMGIAEYDIQDMVDALHEKEQRMRREGKTDAEIQKLDDTIQPYINYLRAYKERRHLRRYWFD